MKQCIFIIILCFNFNSLHAGTADSLGLQLAKEGELMLTQAHYSLALEKFEQATNVFEQQEDWVAFYKERKHIIECHFRLGNTQTVLEMMASEKEKCAQHLGHQHEILGLLYYMDAMVDHRYRDGTQMVALVQKALDILLPTVGKTDRSIANCYNLLGIYWMSKKDYHQALTYFEQSLVIKKATIGAAHSAIGVAYNNMAIAYQYLDKNERAIALYQQALEVKIKHLGNKHPRVSNTYFNIGQVYAKEEKFDQAILFFDRAIAIDRVSEEDQHHKLAHRLTSLSEAYYYKDRYDLALLYGQQAIAYYQKTSQNPVFSATAFQNLGTIYQSSKAYENALPYYQKALAALSLQAINESSLANPTIENRFVSERLFQVLKEKMNTLDAWQQIAPDRCKLAAALNTSEALIQTIALMQQDIVEENSKFIFLEDSRLVFEKALGFCLILFETTGDPIYQEKAFDIYEQSKAFLLRNMLQDARAQTLVAIPDSQKVHLVELKETLNDLAFQLSKTEDEAVKSRLQTELFDKNRHFQSELNALETSFPTYAQTKNELATFRLSDVQQTLKKEEVVVAWFMGQTQLFYFEITNAGFDFQRIEKKKTLEKAIYSFVNLLNDNVLASAKGNSTTLYQDFIQQSNSLFQQLFPTDFNLPPNAILIPDGVLNILPFELLLTVEDKRHLQDTSYLYEMDYSTLPYFIKNTTIRYAYAPSLLLKNGKQQTAAKTEILAFAPTYYGTNNTEYASRAGFSPLEFAQQEIENLDQLFETKTMTGASATKANFKNLASQYRFLHLAMHANLNDESPAFSGLIFSKNPETATLYAYEIANLNLNADLVVLSACNTGAGKLVAGEGPISLARSFRQAGCANVVMSLWQADDETTSVIMNTFYQYLKAGTGKAEALQRAKLDFLQQNRKNFPHYWAAFVLTGDNETIDFGNTNFFNWGLGAALLFVLSVVFFRLKRKVVL